MTIARILIRVGTSYGPGTRIAKTLGGRGIYAGGSDGTRTKDTGD
jgi:hypothetical protein